jgi:signal transduction histidine kinase
MMVSAQATSTRFGYTPRGGVVTLSLICKPSTIEFRVEDTGPGVPLTERENIFERFVRLDGTQTDGSGLGLAIVRELAAQCDAVIRIEEPSHGAHGFCIAVTFH